MTRAEFERRALEHLDAVHSLSRWLLRNREDAEDAVQETFLRAFRASGSFSGENMKPWLLTIARNVAYTWLARRQRGANVISFEDAVLARSGEDGSPSPLQIASPEASPEQSLLMSDNLDLLRRALAELPLPLRETIALREMEDLSYAEIAAVTGAPIGTVMSRLSRARARLGARVAELMEGAERDAM